MTSKADTKLIALTIIMLSSSISLFAYNFHFAQISDTHIRPNHSTIDDLKQSVAQINAMDSLDFVLVTGDITHSGDKESAIIAKQILDSLDIPYYVIPGNHDTKFSRQCIVDFVEVFGAGHFYFRYDSCAFVGINTGQLNSSNGRVADAELMWLDSVMNTLPTGMTKFVISHHPLQEDDIDNFQDLSDVLQRHRICCVLSGHYHINMIFDCLGIPDVVTRTNQSGRHRLSGFSIIAVDNDNISWTEYNHDGVSDTWLELKHE